MTGKSKRGFASMDQAKQKEIASKGGKAAHYPTNESIGENFSDFSNSEANS